MHMIQQRAQTVLGGLTQMKSSTQLCQNVSRCISDMNTLTLNDSPRMIRVTPLPKVFSPASYPKSQDQTNALASLENSSMVDSGVFMSMNKSSSTNNVSECSSGHTETSGKGGDVMCQVTQCDNCVSPSPCDNRPLLPSGVIKVNGPPPLPKPASHLPSRLLSMVTEFIQQNPEMAQNAIRQTSGTKRQCDFDPRKRKKAADRHSQVVSETEGDSALASSCQLSPSSSELGSVHSGDGYFWDSPFMSQSDTTHIEVGLGGTCVGHEEVARDCEAGVLETVCTCVLGSEEKDRPLSQASTSTASTVFGVDDIAVLFSDTDKSYVNNHVIKDKGEKLCEKTGEREKQTKKRKEKKRKKEKHQTDLSANTVTDGGEITPKKQPANYFIAIQVANPEIHERLRAVQEEIVSSSEQLRAALVPLAKLHLTLMVMHLSDSDDQLNGAKLALDKCGKKLREDLSASQLDFNIQGLGNFRNSVVFAKVENGQILDQMTHIAETVTTTFAEECGVLPIDDKGFKPHITIMKLSRSPHLRRKGVRRIEPSLYGGYVETNFGRDSIRSLQLCSMFKPQDATGYYHVAHEVSVRKYSTTATPPGGGSTYCRPGIAEEHKGDHAVDQGTRGRGGGGSVMFTEHLEVPMQWVFHTPTDDD